LFLVLFLFYCAYFMLRFSVDAGPPRMNMSAVYALFGVVLIPVSFLAIRLSQRFIHPVVFDSHAPSNMTGAQWPSFLVSFAALLAYGEAALAYSSPRTTRAATWGVRIGWLAQTALLVVQAARADGFPWSTWAGSLNLFVWLVVGAYLIWGCRPRFRLLGLTVMPLAAVLFVVARLGGGTRAGVHTQYSNLFLVLHVGCVLAAFAGFTLAAALASRHLGEEGR